jgi:hypothetical protein
MSDLIDDVARTLATPMPRRRALKTIGVALAAGAFPALRAGRAAAHPAGSTSTGCADYTCPPGEKVCCVTLAGKGRYNVVGCFDPKTQQCCIGPGPEGEDATWRCPKCSPCGTFTKTCEGGPAPEGCGKTCGPDISDALGDALARTKSVFSRWSSSDKSDACGNLVWIPWATFSWDIAQLSPSGRPAFSKSFGPKCSTCGHSVWVGGSCHFDGSANYAVYGTMMRLCHDHFQAEKSWKAGLHSENSMTLLIAAHKSSTGTVAANVGPAAAWASAAYRGWPGKGSAPAGDRPDCEKCPNDYSGPGLTVQWYPHVIRP